LIGAAVAATLYSGWGLGDSRESFLG